MICWKMRLRKESGKMKKMRCVWHLRKLRLTKSARAPSVPGNPWIRRDGIRWIREMYTLSISIQRYSPKSVKPDPAWSYQWMPWITTRRVWLLLPYPQKYGKYTPSKYSSPGATPDLIRTKIMLDQIRSLDKKRLHQKIGSLDKETLRKACTIARRLISIAWTGSPWEDCFSSPGSFPFIFLLLCLIRIADAQSVTWVTEPFGTISELKNSNNFCELVVKNSWHIPPCKGTFDRNSLY